MEIKTHQEENYLHIWSEGKFDPDAWQNLKDIIDDEANPQYWIICEISDEDIPLSAPMAMELVALSEQCKENGGLLITVASDRNFENQLEELGITSIPSMQEAIDYIFIEQLEKDLGSE